jgi:hypothetical protein
MAAQLSGRTFDMATVHRFTDPEYADLTVRMRAGENPALLFDRLHALDLIVLHESTEAAQEAIAGVAHDGDAITAATNDEVRELNARIRDERVCAGRVDDARTTYGSDGLPIGRGDVIQTRQNDSDLKVANRQTWTVQHVADDGTIWATEVESGRKHQRTLRLPAEYVAEHTHLAYATTAYGVQSVTVDESHTVLSDALDAAGVYVGMTRGRTSNRLHIVATDLDDAREQFTLALERDRADRGLDDATRAAQRAVNGLTVDGPVKLVNRERTRLAQRIEQAERQAEKWERAVAALARQRETHRAQHAEQEEIIAVADARAKQVQAEVAAALTKQAIADGTAYLTARDRMWEATAARDRAGRFGKRHALHVATEAARMHGIIEEALRRRWGDQPTWATAVQPWADAVAGKRADTDPRVTETRRDAERTHREQRRLAERHLHESAALHREVLGSATPSTASTRAAQWHSRADQARHDLAQIEALPLTEAAQRVRDRAARAEVEKEAAAHALAAHDTRATNLDHWRSPSTGHTRPGPEHGGLGL